MESYLCNNNITQVRFEDYLKSETDNRFRITKEVILSDACLY